jgi:magnesium-transporting ATPase (P-type)
MEWWSKPSEEVIKALSSSKEGLSEVEAKKRLSIYGLNDIPKRMEKSAISLFLSQFKDPLLLLLLAATIIAYLTGSVEESIMIVCILLIDSILGFFQEYKSELALRKFSTQKVTQIRYWSKFIRDGNLLQVDTRYLVSGDIIL